MDCATFTGPAVTVKGSAVEVSACESMAAVMEFVPTGVPVKVAE